MKKLFILLMVIVLAAIYFILPSTSNAVRWEFDNDVIVDGNLVVYGTLTAPPGSINLDNVTLNLNNFPADLRPVKVVSSLPTCLDNNYPEGSVVYLTTDYKLYRCRDNGNWTSLIESTDLGGYLQPSVFSDNIITNNMIAGGIAASKIAVDNLSAFRADMGLLTAGEIQLGYLPPGNNNTTPGTGVRIGDGKIEAYGTDQTFGGTIMSSDGYFMVTIGQELTATGLEIKYPINNVTNFSGTGQIHVYYWDATTWVQAAQIGYNGTSGATIEVLGQSNQYAIRGGNTAANNSAAHFYNLSNDATYYASGFPAALSAAAMSNGYAAKFDGGKSPLLLIPSSSSDAPTHQAAKGSLWVTSAGILYINTDGSTTWGKVGSQ